MGNVTLSKSIMKELDAIKGKRSYSAVIEKLMRQSHKRRQDLAFNDTWEKCMNDLHQHIFTIETHRVRETFLNTVGEDMTYNDVFQVLRACLIVEIIDYYELPTNF